jgi:hypothetical protein
MCTAVGLTMIAEVIWASLSIIVKDRVLPSGARPKVCPLASSKSSIDFTNVGFTLFVATALLAIADVPIWTTELALAVCPSIVVPDEVFVVMLIEKVPGSTWMNYLRSNRIGIPAAMLIGLVTVYVRVVTLVHYSLQTFVEELWSYEEAEDEG